MWRFWQIFEAADIVVTDEFPTQLVSILSGTGSILVLGLLVRRLTSDATDRVLLFAFIFTGGATQLFFGYMENYTLLYFAILLFVHLSVLHLEGDVPLAYPMAGLGLLLVTHFASLIFLPPALFLAWRCASARKWRELAAGTASFVVVSSSLLMLCGYSIPGFFYLLMNSEKHMMPLMEITSRYQAYTLFSGAHLLNLANLHLLLSPFALVLFLIAGTGRRRAMLMQNPTLLFLAIGGICGLIFTTAVNADLGMSRDWDLLAPFLLIVLIAGGLFGIRFIERPAKRRRLMALVASIMILHSGSWIALNADEDRSLDRFLALADERFWGPSSLTSAYEVLGYLYFERGDLRQTALFLEKYISKDDSYLPVWERLGEVYRYLRDEENELRANEGAIRLGSRHTATYINAGLAHSSRGNLARAMELTQGALDIDPGSVEANNNYGIFILQGGGRCEEAVPYFLRSISSDSSFSGAYFNTARCYVIMGEGGKAVQYAESYLRIDPGGMYAGDARMIVTTGGQ
jgi:Tfp pilus assembly protein PilF